MKLLLDTHAFLWFIDGNPKLSAGALKSIGEPENSLYLSIASLWEIAIKVSTGRLRFDIPVAKIVRDELEKNGISLLSIDVAHVVQIAAFPYHHRDPFDRMLAVQCLVEEMSIISKDEAFDLYSVPRVW